MEMSKGVDFGHRGGRRECCK